MRQAEVLAAKRMVGATYQSARRLANDRIPPNSAGSRCNGKVS